MTNQRELRPQKRPALAGRLAVSRRLPLALTAAALIVACAVVATFLTNRRDDGRQVTPSFLTRALGAPQPGAPLVRKPAPGRRVAIGKHGFAYRTAGTPELALEAAGVRGSAWRRYEHGTHRTTAFGSESVTLDGDRVEHSLTLSRRLGTHTWRWRLDSKLVPRVSPNGYVGFFDPSTKALADVEIEPVTIFDAKGKDVTPAGARWSVARTGAQRWLTLTLDDERLPLPYTIDPVVAPRAAGAPATTAGAGTLTLGIPATVLPQDLILASVAVKSATLPATPSGWTLTANVANAANVTTALYRRKAVAGDESGSVGFTVAAASSGAISVLQGVDTSGSPIQQAAVTSTAGSKTSVACPSVTTNIANEYVLCVVGISTNATTWSTPSAYAELHESSAGASQGTFGQAVATSGTAVTGTINPGATGNPKTAEFTLGLTPDTDNPTHGTISLAAAPAPSSAYLNGSTLYFNGGVAGSFALVDPATDAQSSLVVTYPTVTAATWSHAAETVSAGPSFTSSQYTWGIGAGTPVLAERTLTATDGFGHTATSVLTFVNDTTMPGGGTITGVPAYDGDGTFSFAVAADTDLQSGVATQVLTRQKATLAGDTCTTWVNDVTLPVAATVNETTLAGPQCYRYVLVRRPTGSATRTRSRARRSRSTRPRRRRRR